MSDIKYYTYDDAIQLMTSLSQSQGLYGRLLEAFKLFEEDDIERMNQALIDNNIQTELDFILFIEA